MISKVASVSTWLYCLGFWQGRATSLWGKTTHFMGIRKEIGVGGPLKRKKGKEGNERKKGRRKRFLTR